MYTLHIHKTTTGQPGKSPVQSSKATHLQKNASPSTISWMDKISHLILYLSTLNTMIRMVKKTTTTTSRWAGIKVTIGNKSRSPSKKWISITRYEIIVVQNWLAILYYKYSLDISLYFKQNTEKRLNVSFKIQIWKDFFSQHNHTTMKRLPFLIS